MSDRKLPLIDLKNWELTPHTSGRVSTEDDVKEGKAVFRIDSKGLVHKAIDINLPALAYHINQETNQKTLVIVIQAERVGEQEVAGLRYLDNGEGACLFGELEFVDKLDLL